MANCEPTVLTIIMDAIGEAFRASLEKE